MEKFIRCGVVYAKIRSRLSDRIGARAVLGPYGAEDRIFNVRRGLARLIGIAGIILFCNGAVAKDRVILALGDSLTAGYGLPSQHAFPARLEAALRETGAAVRVINAGVSGDTSGGGLARVDWLLVEKPDLVIVELGANDGLRGLDPAMTRRNVDAIIGRMKRAGVRVLLTGMLAPPNLGRGYGGQFNEIFPLLAKRHKVAFYPFFLDGVAADPALNQADGIHPNAKGVSVIVERILPHVLQVLGE